MATLITQLKIRKEKSSFLQIWQRNEVSLHRALFSRLAKMRICLGIFGNTYAIIFVRWTEVIYSSPSLFAETSLEDNILSNGDGLSSSIQKQILTIYDRSLTCFCRSDNVMKNGIRLGIKLISITTDELR